MAVTVALKMHSVRADKPLRDSWMLSFTVMKPRFQRFGMPLFCTYILSTVEHKLTAKVPANR